MPPAFSLFLLCLHFPYRACSLLQPCGVRRETTVRGEPSPHCPQPVPCACDNVHSVIAFLHDVCHLQARGSRGWELQSSTSNRTVFFFCVTLRVSFMRSEWSPDLRIAASSIKREGWHYTLPPTLHHGRVLAAGDTLGWLPLDSRATTESPRTHTLQW